MKTNLLSAALTALCLFASSAMAYEPFASKNEDGGGTIYGGVSAGKTEMTQDLDALAYDGNGIPYLYSIYCSSGECDGNNWKIFGGYNITSNLAVEGAYHKLTGGDDFNISGLSVAGLYNFPVQEHLKVFGKVGAMTWKFSDNSAAYEYDYTDGTDLLFGAGATYDLNENWGIRGEYEQVDGNLGSNMYSVGAVFSSM